MKNSADPDELASSEACLQRQGSAGQGLLYSLPNIFNKSIWQPVDVSETIGCVANSANPDQMLCLILANTVH